MEKKVLTIDIMRSFLMKYGCISGHTIHHLFERYPLTQIHTI